MIPSAVQEVSVIRVKSKRMSRRITFNLGLLCLILCHTFVLISCGSTQKTSIPSNNTLSQAECDPLSPEERRKFDYYFLEAVRLKGKGDVDAAFEMYSHCLDIHPERAETLCVRGWW